MEKQYEHLLDNLFKAEGGYLHRNSKESDITNAYGIYRYRQPQAALWTYIDSVAKKVTSLPSKSWDKATIEKIDKLIDKNKERELSYQFYKEFFKTAYLELFPDDLVIMVANLYANTPKGATEAIQEALRDVAQYGLIDMFLKDMPPVIGRFGPSTRRAVTRFTELADRKDIIIFKNCALLYMKTYYADLVISKTDTMLPNLKGWNNRMEDLQHQS